MEAHRLFAEGQPAAAAPLFVELAGMAHSLNMPRRAAQMHLQAARSFAASGNKAAVLEQARAALQVLIGAELAEEATLVLPRLVREMRERGMTAEAGILQHEIQEQLGLSAEEWGEASAPPAKPARGRLPAKCPGCGGPVRSDEVEWIDEHSAECVYCGSVLPTEK
jgi:hypothetical protein